MFCKQLFSQAHVAIDFEQTFEHNVFVDINVLILCHNAIEFISIFSAYCSFRRRCASNFSLVELERVVPEKPNNNHSLQNVDVENHGRDYKTAWQGTAAWMAPEVMGMVYGPSVDVFSFGVVMWELLTSRIPWAGSGYSFSHQILKAVVRGERPVVTEEDLEHVPAGYVALMEQCWRTNSKERPTFERVMSVLSTFSTTQFSSVEVETKSRVHSQ